MRDHSIKKRYLLVTVLFQLLLVSRFFSLQTRDGAIYQEGREVVTINEWTGKFFIEFRIF
jgi:hypothetical protein